MKSPVNIFYILILSLAMDSLISPKLILLMMLVCSTLLWNHVVPSACHPFAQSFIVNSIFLSVSSNPRSNSRVKYFHKLPRTPHSARHSFFVSRKSGLCPSFQLWEMSGLLSIITTIIPLCCVHFSLNISLKLTLAFPKTTIISPRLRSPHAICI